MSRRSNMALVGHEPDLGEMAGHLSGLRHRLEFKKGAVCRIDIDDLPPAGPGDLRWMLTPKILRALKK
jgi:phosphohistidine phosphatase